MSFDRLITRLRALDEDLSQLVAAEAQRERDDTLRLATGASLFTREAKAMVDDKLAFSATLMRAGEVHAAQEMLADVERKVAEEQAALIEVVNEVRASRSVRRARITRLRLARTLAAAMLSAALLGSTALAAAVAGGIEDLQAGSFAEPRGDAWRGAGPALDHRLPTHVRRAFEIAGSTWLLTPWQLRRAERAVAAAPGTIDEALLDGLPAELVAHLGSLVSDTSTEAGDAVRTARAVVRETADDADADAAPDDGARDAGGERRDRDDDEKGSGGGSGDDTNGGLLNVPQEAIEEIEDRPGL